MTDAETVLLTVAFIAMLLLAVGMFAFNSEKPGKKHYDLEYTFEPDYKLTIERVSQDVLDELTDSPHISEREARARAIHREVDRRRAAERKSDDE